MRKKLFIASVTAMLLMAGSALAQGPRGHHGPEGQPPQEQPDAMAGATQSQEGLHNMQNAQHGFDMEAMELTSTKFILLPAPQGMGERFVIIDSIDNCIDVVMRQGDTLVRTGHYLVDEIYGRHDVGNIIRPQSIAVIDNHIIFVGEAKKDTGRVGILTIKDDTILVSQLINVACHCSAMRLFGENLYVVGTTTEGYDINIYSLTKGTNGPELKPLACRHYHVPKQSERIQASDPSGVGLTVVAIVVVFIALICIAIIIGLFAKVIRKSQNRRAQAAAAKAGQPKETAISTMDTAGDVYAAIAAAIYLYQEDMHDEENAILTIDKVERAWTPWNAKFYNMNQYFNSRRR